MNEHDISRRHFRAQAHNHKHRKTVGHVHQKQSGGQVAMAPRPGWREGDGEQGNLRQQRARHGKNALNLD